ncbi:hypothetical protein Tco_0280515 [Tanacetum coccineum]
MANLKFADTHNMVAFLSKPVESDGFEQIVNFLNAHSIRRALMINPTIYISCIEQFWFTVKAKTINGKVQLHALVDGKKIIITEASVRRDLQLEDEEVVRNQLELGEGLANSIDPHHIPTIIQSSTQPQKTQKPWKPKRKDTRVPQPSDPSENVTDEVVHKELGDSLLRAATTASSLEAEQDSGNITKTQSKATPNESSSLGTTSGGGPKCQETMGILLLKLARVESFGDEEDLGEDASKQERMINDIDADEDITLEVFVARQNENVVEEVVDAAQVSTAATTVIITTEEITLAQALDALKTSKPKVKGIVFQESGKSTTTTTIISSQQSQDKGKGIMIEEPMKTIKKKDLIKLDEEVALKLQAEFDKEERLAREKAKKEKEANIALIET